MNGKYKRIGDILAAARLEQQKTLKDAAEATKISVRHLQLVESGNTVGLPSEAYFMLFARSYAQFLGIDPAVFDEFESVELNGEEATSRKTRKRNGAAIETESAEQASKFWRLLLYLGIPIIILFVAVVVYSVWFSDRQILSGPEDEQIVEEGSGDTSLPEAVEDSGLTVPDIAYQPPEKLVLYMRAKQDVWTLVVRDGDTVLNRELKAGEDRQWEARYRYLLTLGISTAVDMTLNGEQLAPLTDRPRTVGGLEINQANYRQFLLTETAGEPSLSASSTETDSTGRGEDSPNGD